MSHNYFDFDLHIHTFHSPCGWDEMIPEDILRTAAERRIKRLGFTDHYYTFTDSAQFDALRAAVSDARSTVEGMPEVFFGCEAEVMAPGRTSGSQELADRLDYVMIGATHFMNKGVTDLPPGDEAFHGRYYLQMFEYAVSHPWVDVLAHPFFVAPGVCSIAVLDVLKDSDLLPGIEMAKENNIAMEISRRVFTLPGQLEFSLRFLGLCKKAGLKFTLGSDAHIMQDVGNVQLLKPVIDELALTEKDFWLP